MFQKHKKNRDESSVVNFNFPLNHFLANLSLMLFNSYCYLGWEKDFVTVKKVKCVALPSSYKHGRPQTFFQGRAKIFRGGGGGAKTYFLPKKQQKDTIFPKKSKNILYLAGQGGGGKSPPCPPLRTPMLTKSFTMMSQN
jgi:hypothetical protein